MSSHSSLKPILYALGANCGIAITKTVAAAYTGSGAMMAEAIHSFADTGNQILLLVGLKRSEKPADELHPFGYGRAMYFWAMLVAVLLFTMGGLFSVYEGVERVMHPEEVSSPLVAIVVLIIGILLEGGSLMGALKEIRVEQGDYSLWQWFQQTRKSELMVVAGEDAAALLGLVFAMLAVGLSWVTGNPVFDAAGSILVGILLMIVAVLVGREIKSLIIGESASREEQAAIQQFLENHEAVDHVYNLMTLQWGNHLVVAVKARMKGDKLPSDEMIRLINRCEAELKAANPSVKWLFFEPDIKA